MNIIIGEPCRRSACYHVAERQIRINGQVEFRLLTGHPLNRLYETSSGIVFILRGIIPHHLDL